MVLLSRCQTPRLQVKFKHLRGHKVTTLEPTNILPTLIGLLTLTESEGLNTSNDPKGCAGSSIATGRASHAGEVEWEKRHSQTTPQTPHFTAFNKMVSMYCWKPANMTESNGEPVTILITKTFRFGYRKYYLDRVAYLSRLLLSCISSGPSVIGASVAPASQLCLPAMFVLMISEN